MRSSQVFNSKTFLVPLILVLLLNLCFVESAKKAKKNRNGSGIKADEEIVGGKPTGISSMPYIVQLYVKDKFACGGSMVTRSHVVTACHCVAKYKPKDLWVKGGAVELSEPGIKRNVETIFMTEQFNAETLNHDLCVLKLGKPMTGPKTGTIDLCTANWKAGDYVQVSGWGDTSEDSKEPSNHLRTVRVPLISKKDCVKDYQNVLTLTDSMFCASVPGDKDTCSGDSGGPLVFNNQLCGVTSFGIGCANPNYYGVYTSVKTMEKFIRNSMAK